MSAKAGVLFTTELFNQSAHAYDSNLKTYEDIEFSVLRECMVVCKSYAPIFARLGRLMSECDGIAA